MMAVRRPEATSPAVAVISNGGSHGTEPTPTAVCDNNGKNTSETVVDSDFGEKTEDETHCMDLFPKYLDCQETLVELSFIKWLNGFRAECRTMSSGLNKNIFYGLLNFFSVNLGPEIVECRNKINRSTLLETYLEPILMFFRKCHKTIQEPLNDLYYDRTSLMLAYYLDLKIMACHRHADDRAWLRKTSSKISVALHVYLDGKFDYMIDTIFQMYYTFYGATTINGTLIPLILPAIKKLLAEQPIPKTKNVLTFLRYILCFKLWKKMVYSSSLSTSDKRKEADQIRMLVRRLNTPNEIISELQKYNWPNWPKLKSSYEKPNERELKNIPMILYNANFPIKDAFKDMHDSSRTDVPRLLTMVEEQCKILRSDLFAVTSKEVKDSWNLYFDMKIAPHISSTRSCNSLLRQFKYYLYSDPIEKLSEQEKSVNDLNLTSFELLSLINSSKRDPKVIKKLRGNSESHTLQPNEIVSSQNNSFQEDNLKANHLIESNSGINEENKQNKNERIAGVLKSVNINDESFPPINVKQQPTEDKIISKKLKLSGHNRFPSAPYSTENNTNHVNNPGCSSTSTRKIKRSHPTSLSDFEKSNKCCRLKSRKEKHLTSSNKNQNIFSGYQNPNHTNSDDIILNNDNSLPKNFKNIEEQNTSIDFCLINKSTAGENIPERKSICSELSVASVSNSKCLQSNFLDRDKNQNLENSSSEVNYSACDPAFPSNNTQRTLLLPPCNPVLLKSKPLVNTLEQMEIDITSYNYEVNSSPMTNHVLSMRNSKETSSKLVSSRQTINENENTQIYALPMDQELTHVEHPYVENPANSVTRDLEVVNVLSPVSINSTDIPMNKSSWVPDISLVHENNDVDCDHSQSSMQQFNVLGNSIDPNTSCSSNHHCDVEHLNYMQLESPIISRPCSYNQVEPRIYPDDSFTADFSSSESSVSNSAYFPFDLNQTSTTVPVQYIPATVSSKVIHDSNNPTISSYCGKNINSSFNELKTNSPTELQSSYSVAINKMRPNDRCSVQHTAEKVSPSNKNKTDTADVVFDRFSDMDSIDFRVKALETKEINSCLISKDTKLVNPLDSFEKSEHFLTLKNQNNSSNLHPQKKLKMYSDPTELISKSVNLNKQSGTPININETHAQEVFLGNESPSQVYYNQIADFCVSSDEMANLEDIKLSNLKNKPITINQFNTCSNDKYTHAVLKPIDNSPSLKQTFISGHEGVNRNSPIIKDSSSTCINDKYVHNVLQRTDNSPSVKQKVISGYDDVNQNLPIVNNRLIYNPSILYQNSIQLQNKSPDYLSSPHNGLTYTNFDQMSGLGLQEDPNKKEQPVMNMSHLMVQTTKNCKVHYKWPLNKIRSPSTAPNEIVNSDSSFNDRKNDGNYHSSRQFQDIPNLIVPNISPVIQSRLDSADENRQTQSRAAVKFESKLQKESINNQELISRNANLRSQSPETHSALSREVFEAARYLFNEGKLFLCMYPKCSNSHHFRVLPSKAVMLSHEFTVPFDDFRFNIQYNFKRIIESSHIRTWPSLPKLEILTKRCSCGICADLEFKMNKNQEMLHSYIESKKNEHNYENEQLTDQQIRLSSWKKNLANRFSTEDDAKQNIAQLIVDMESHVNRFKQAFAIVFALSKDVKLNLENLKKACKSYTKVNDYSFNSECIEKLDIAHKFFNDDLLLYSYQYYLQIPLVIPKDVLENLANSSYQASNPKVLSTSPEKTSAEMIKYLIEHSLSHSSKSINSNLIRLSLKYIKENVSNTSHLLALENVSSTSRQLTIRNLTISPQPVLNNYPSTYGISLNSSSLINDKVNIHHQMAHYYADGHTCTEIPHSYLQVPRDQYPNTTTNSYYGSPSKISSDKSKPFCSQSRSVDSMSNSPSSDCSLPSLVETVATAVPEHALMDNSLEAVNAAHNLMLISNRHRYNNTTSVATTNSLDTVTVTTTATTNVKTVKKTYISITKSKAAHTSPTNTINNNISLLQTSNNNIYTADTSNNVKPSITKQEDQEKIAVHSSRKKKKKKHDKKRDKKKKGKH